ncbi:MAG: large repetitive protein, partial [Microbacteriaceae bacterium]|nr:large repetitive protein [Microbacteriaceae bacterium]
MRSVGRGLRHSGHGEGDSPHRTLRRAAAPISVLVVSALVIVLGVEPAAAITPVSESASLPAAVAPAAPAALAPVAPAVIPLRDAEVLIVQSLPRDQARAALDAKFAAEEQRRRAATVRQTQARNAQVEQRAYVEQVVTAQQAASAAQAAADAQLQAALAALAKALSTSQCTTVGGTNGQPASVSCPMENGNATIAGDDNVQVTTPVETAQPMTASSLPADPVGPEQALSEGALADAVSQATAEWAAAGGDVSGITALVGSLSGATLGEASGRSIVLDDDAAGWGWSRMDLLTVVRHEIGHALGADHGSGLMSETLSPGESWGVDPTVLPAAEPVSEPAPVAAEPVVTESTAPTPAVESDPLAASTPDAVSTVGTNVGWVVAAGTATLTLTAAAGTLRLLDGRIVFATAAGASIAVDAAGLTAVVVRGADGAAAFTVDLTGIAGLALAIDGATDSLSVAGLTSAARLTGDGDRLRLDWLGASLSFLAPRLAALVESTAAIALAGTISLPGTDVTVQGRSITVQAGTTLDTR